MSARETWAGCPATRAAGKAAREYMLAGKWLRAPTDSIWKEEKEEGEEEEEEAAGQAGNINSILSIHVACDVVQAVMLDLR